jgi:hypothetical protein
VQAGQELQAGETLGVVGSADFPPSRSSTWRRATAGRDWRKATAVDPPSISILAADRRADADAGRRPPPAMAATTPQAALQPVFATAALP